VLRGCRDEVAGLLLTLSCALLLAVLAARLDVAWLLVLGVWAYADPGLPGFRSSEFERSSFDKKNSCSMGLLGAILSCL